MVIITCLSFKVFAVNWSSESTTCNKCLRKLSGQINLDIMCQKVVETGNLLLCRSSQEEGIHMAYDERGLHHKSKSHWLLPAMSIIGILQIQKKIPIEHTCSSAVYICRNIFVLIFSRCPSTKVLTPLPGFELNAIY